MYVHPTMPHTVTATNASHWMSQNAQNKARMRVWDVTRLDPFGKFIIIIIIILFLFF